MNELLTPGATAWFALLLAVVTFGVPAVRNAVAFVRANLWEAKGKAVWVLSILSSFLWVVFWFQPGLLNLEAFKLLPAWQSYVAAILGIALQASGSVDAARDGKE